MTYIQEVRRNKKLLELSLKGLYPERKDELRALFALLEQQGWSVYSYGHVLEEALKLVNRAYAAAKALDGADGT